MGWLRRVAAGSALAVLGMSLALLVVEGTVRALHIVPDRFWEADPVRGLRLIAGKTGWWTQEDLEFRTHVRINDAGFRDVAHTMAKPAGVFRIMLLGDSFIEAMQVPLKDTLARRLERSLDTEPDRRFEVLSLGVSGYGTAGEFLTYRDVGRLYRPDLVVLSVYPGNDVRNNSPTLEDMLPPEYSADGTLLRVRWRTSYGGRPRGVLGRLLSHSRAYRFFRKLVLMRHPSLARGLDRFGMIRHGAVPVPDSRGGIPVDYQIYARSAAPEWQDAWRRTERLIEDLRAAVRANGARFAVLVVAGRDQIYPELWGQIVEKNPAMKGKAWDVMGPERRLTAWCVRHGIPVLSLSEAFLAARDTEPPLHYRYDGHWTVAGHRVAARAVAKFLRGTDLLTAAGGRKG